MADRRIAFLLFVFLNCDYVLTSSGRPRTPDEYMTLFQAESLLERGSTAVPQALKTNNFYGRFDLEGQPRPPYPPGLAILSVPYVWMAREAMARVPGVSRDMITRLYLDGFGATLSSSTFAAAAMATFFLLLRRLELDLRGSLLLTACVAFGTLLFSYSGYFFSEPLSTLLLLGATYALFGAATEATRGREIAAVILGFAGWVRPTMFLATPIFALATVLRGGIDRWKVATRVLVLPAASLMAYLAWNKHLFGRALEFGYPETSELGKHLNTFHAPFYIGLTGFLVSPGKSIFLFCPLVALAIFGIPPLWRRDRGLATVCAGLPLLFLLFYMRYTQWEGGYCNGPRYLLPSLIVCCVALGHLLKSKSGRLRQTVLILAVLGLAVQIVTFSTNFLEDQVGSGTYYDAGYDYRLSYNPLVTQTQRLFAYLGGKPSGLGSGFDRWFVFLSKLGIGRGALVAIAIPPLALAIWSFSKLWRIWKTSEVREENGAQIARA